MHNHPFFKLVALGASSRSAGQPYIKATRWKQSKPVPESVKDVIIKECTTENFKDCDIVFSGLDHDVAGPIGEWLLAEKTNLTVIHRIRSP